MQKHLLLITVAALTPLLVSYAASPKGGNEIELDEAAVFIEFNSTDGDFGIQFFWDGEPWDQMTVLDTVGQHALRVRTHSPNLRRHGLTEGFFESAEPDIEELDMDQFFLRFPEGEYEFEGFTLDGDELEGEADFTHDLPAPPSGLFPADGAIVDSAQALLVGFDPVTQDLFGNPLLPELYELVVETEDRILKVFSLTLDGDVQNPVVTLPPQWLEPGTEYKLEVIVQEESGNRTISEVEFETL